MTDFGFSMNRSSAIDLSKADLSIYDALLEEVPAASTCIACGSCTASCPAQPFSGMSVRKLILALQRGASPKSASSQSVSPQSVSSQGPGSSMAPTGQDPARLLSCCMLCGKCTMVCPRGINTRQLILTVCRIYG